MDTSEIVWRPDPAAAERTHLGRFLRALGLPALETLQRRSVDDVGWDWGEVARDLGWQWSTPYTAVVDTTRGIQWPRWFLGGRRNLAQNAVDAWIDLGRGDEPAVISEAEDGGVRTLTYAELSREVARLANALARLGVSPGDRVGVGVFLPMCQEAAIAILAISRLGAIRAEADGRRGPGAVSDGPSRQRPQAHRRRRPVAARTRSLVARPGRVRVERAHRRARGARSPGARCLRSGLRAAARPSARSSEEAWRPWPAVEWGRGRPLPSAWAATLDRREWATRATEGGQPGRRRAETAIWAAAAAAQPGTAR
jgi:hypothetical protein